MKKAVDNRPDLKGGYVYFARGEITKMIKIGHSILPEKRECGLQSSSGEKIKIIMTVPGSRRDEKRFHTQFRAQRERGEWFREEDRLHAFLKARNLHLPEKEPCFISVTEYPDLKLLEGVVRGYCVSKETKQKLIDYGIPERAIYLRGNGAEDLPACLRSFRGDPGWLVVAQDLRLFGESGLPVSKKAVTEQVGELERRRVRLLDIAHPEDKTYAALVHRAHALIAGTRFETVKGRAKRVGRKGGEAKGVEMALKRNAILREDIAKRLCEAPELSWRRKAYILGKEYGSAATLFRTYGKK